MDTVGVFMVVPDEAWVPIALVWI